MVYVLDLGFQYLSYLGFWSNMSVWFHMWQSVAFMVFLCVPLLWAIVVPPLFIVVGLFYGVIMLADMDVYDEAGEINIGCSLSGVKTELYSLMICRGARTYFLAPMTVRGLHHREKLDIEEVPLQAQVLGITEEDLAEGSGNPTRTDSIMA